MGFKVFEKNRMVIGAAIVCCLIMVIFPEITATASKEAINLWLNSVVPVLLPFFIAANFLKNTGIVSRISPTIYPFAMGMLSGYPMGARIAGDYYLSGYLSREQLYQVLSYSMITGPAFLIGTVGHEFLGSHQLGIVLAVSHYAGALINRVFYGKAGEKTRRKENRFRTGAVRSQGYYEIFTDAILDSFRSVAVILAYIIIFMIAVDLIQFSGLLKLAPTAEASALLKGILEMTVGCNSLRMCQCSGLVKLTLAAFIVTFGGLSVMGQSMSMLRGCGVSFRRLLLMKLTQALVSAIIAFSVGAFVV